MNLKDLLEYSGEIIKEVLNNYYHKAPTYRVHFRFEDYLDDLAVCPICGDINERNDMTYHKWDTGEIEELICETCRNDEDI